MYQARRQANGFVVIDVDFVMVAQLNKLLKRLRADVGRFNQQLESGRMIGNALLLESFADLIKAFAVCANSAPLAVLRHEIYDELGAVLAMVIDFRYQADFAQQQAFIPLYETLVAAVRNLLAQNLELKELMNVEPARLRPLTRLALDEETTTRALLDMRPLMLALEAKYQQAQDLVDAADKRSVEVIEALQSQYKTANNPFDVTLRQFALVTGVKVVAEELAVARVNVEFYLQRAREIMALGRESL